MKNFLPNPILVLYITRKAETKDYKAYMSVYKFPQTMDLGNISNNENKKYELFIY